MSLLILENIVKEYKNQCVLNGVTLRVERGERVALVGPNGAGKTTLLKLAMGIENSDKGRVTIARNIKVGYLSQDLNDVQNKEGETAFHYGKVAKLEKKLRELEKQMDEQSHNAGSASYKSIMDEYSRLLIRYEMMDGYTIETKIKKILVGLGLRHESLSTPFKMLSGGEKMRVSVAKLLLEEPDLLLLDEPTNHLDIQATEWLESFLKKFVGGILFVSHDRYFLDRVATRVAEIEKGSICVRSGSYSNFIEQKKQQRQFVLNEQSRLRWTIKNTKDLVQGLKSKGKIRASKSREKSIQKLNEELKIDLAVTKNQEHLYLVDMPKIEFKEIKHLSKDIAWAENLKKEFGKVPLFNGANFHVRGGDKVGIIGPNGSGKTTLIKMLLGKDKKYEGFLRLGEWVKYSYMGQEVLFQNNNLTILQHILAQKEMQERVARDYLTRFQFYGDEVEKNINVLSGGERVRLYLACVILENPDCLILDEPTNHLDVMAREAVEGALKEYKGTIIAVTHDRYYLTHCVEKILEIENGKIITYEGNYEYYKKQKFGIDQEVAENKPAKQAPLRNKNSQGKSDTSSKGEKTAQRREEIENQIEQLEAKLKEMESLFDKLTPPAKYKEYNELLEELDCLYSNWDDLI